MAIYDPVPKFNTNDRRLLHLLGQLLLQHLDDKPSLSNIGPDGVALSDREALELLELIQRLVLTKEFLEKISFVERMVDGQSADERQVREIYLSGRRKAGRTRVASSWQWADFQTSSGNCSLAELSPRSYPHNGLRAFSGNGKTTLCCT